MIDHNNDGLNDENNTDAQRGRLPAGWVYGYADADDNLPTPWNPATSATCHQYGLYTRLLDATDPDSTRRRGCAT